MLIEPVDDGGFESYAVVALEMIRLDIDMCGLGVADLPEDLEQCFAVMGIQTSLSVTGRMSGSTD